MVALFKKKLNCGVVACLLFVDGLFFSILGLLGSASCGFLYKDGLSVCCSVFDELFQVGDVAVDRKILVVVINGCLVGWVVAG